MSNETKTDPLNDWFRKIGTSLSDEHYEAGIRAITAHDAAVAAKALREAAGVLRDEHDEAMRKERFTEAAEIRADILWLHHRADRIEREGGAS